MDTVGSVQVSTEKSSKVEPAWPVGIAARFPKPKRRGPWSRGELFPGTVSVFGPGLRITEGHGFGRPNGLNNNRSQPIRSRLRKHHMEVRLTPV
jgi:hypothetical protein